MTDMPTGTFTIGDPLRSSGKGKTPIADACAEAEKMLAEYRHALRDGVDADSDRYELVCMHSLIGHKNVGLAYSVELQRAYLLFADADCPQPDSIVTADPMAERQTPLELADPAAERGVGQVEPAHLLRKQIEGVIREYGADPAEAALAVCVILDGNLGLAEDGWFDDDETVLNAIIAGNQADD